MAEEQTVTRQDMCPHCGRMLDWSKAFNTDDGRRFVECEACQRTIEDLSGQYTPEIQVMLVDANKSYNKQDFEEAIDSYAAIIAKNPRCYEAYWMRMLANNGIKYEEDDGFKPTCSRANFDSILEQADYKKAIELAPENIKSSYEQNAKAIEEIRKKVLEQSDTGEDYDVFISFKKTDEETKSITSDYNDAHYIYNILKDNNYKVFFSDATLKGVPAKDYEPYIFRALSKAKVMLLYCSKAEYANGTWVKNEWMRYLRMINDGSKKPDTLLTIFPDQMPAGMPKQLAKKQGLRFNNPTFFSELNEFLTTSFAKYPSENQITRKTFDSKKNFGPKKTLDTTLHVQRKEFVGKQMSVEDSALVKMAEKYLSQRIFGQAERYCKSALIKNPQLALPKLYLKYAENGITDDKDYISKYNEYPNSLIWLNQVLQECNDTDTYNKIIALAKGICDRAIKEKNTSKIVEAFNLVAEWADEDNTEQLRDALLKFANRLLQEAQSKSALENNKGDATGVFEAVIKTYSNDQVNEYAATNYKFAHNLHMVKLYDDALTYYDKALELVDDSQWYLSRLLAKNHMISERELTPMQSVEEQDLENILRAAPSEQDRRRLQATLANMSICQVNADNASIGTKIFDYIIQFIPQEDVERNKKYLIPFANALLSNKNYAGAGPYFAAMINIDDTCIDAHWGKLKSDLRCATDKDLLFCHTTISENEHYAKISAFAAVSSEDEATYYSYFDMVKTMLHEYGLEREGLEALSVGKFDEAKEKFNSLLEFEFNERKLKLSIHPEAYWGLMLAEYECKNDLDLFNKRDVHPASEYKQTEFYKKYRQSFARLDSVEENMLSVSAFGRKGSPISQDELRRATTSGTKDHDAVMEIHRLNYERMKYKTKAENIQRQLNQNLIETEKKQKREIERRQKGAKASKVATTVTMIIFSLLVIAGGLFACVLFYLYDPTQAWYGDVMARADLTFGLPIGLLGVAGGVIGFFGGGPGAAVGGALLGGVAGLVISALVLACCFALPPVGAALIIAGAIVLAVSVDRNKKRKLQRQIEDYKNDVAALAEKNKRQVSAQRNKIDAEIQERNRQIRQKADQYGIDLTDINLSDETVAEIQGRQATSFRDVSDVVWIGGSGSNCVELDYVGPNRYDVIRAIRSYTNMEYNVANSFVAGVSRNGASTIPYRFDRNKAQAFVQSLQRAGAGAHVDNCR